jgi:hypothetical protein
MRTESVDIADREGEKWTCAPMRSFVLETKKLGRIRHEDFFSVAWSGA